jgi:hypothetical protein
MHEAARLWHSSESATLSACVSYRRSLKPGWSLTWFRDVAAHVLNDAVPQSALLQALNKHVPERARNSVWQSVELLIGFARSNKWSGVALPDHDVPVGLGLAVKLRPVGMFFSPVRNERYLLALQPRLDYAPTLEQERIWLSSLYYEFCCDRLQPLRPAIVDLGRDKGASKRELRELGIEQLPILELGELNARLSLIASCYKRAIEMVPPPSPKPKEQKPSGQGKLFPDDDEDGK